MAFNYLSLLISSNKVGRSVGFFRRDRAKQCAVNIHHIPALSRCLLENVDHYLNEIGQSKVHVLHVFLKCHLNYNSIPPAALSSSKAVTGYFILKARQGISILEQFRSFQIILSHFQIKWPVQGHFIFWRVGFFRRRCVPALICLILNL